MLNLLKKKMPHPDTNHAYYTRGDTFTAGSESLVYNTTLLHPLEGPGGIVCGQLRVFQPPTIYQSLTLPTQPLIAGIQAGQLEMQALTQQANDGQYYDAPVM